ncbi:MAG TPA: PAS domain-containing protein, partial [Solirubrobacteraceae bacterium]|nr:PAS domain-containing protein [Solirubrobacteraceae bacterium]
MREEVFEAAPVGLGVFDADLRWAEANDALAALTGHTVAELLGRRPSEVLGPVGVATEEAVRRVRASGEAERLAGSGTLPERPGVERSWATVLFPLPDAGAVGVAAVEVTEQVAGERQLAAVARRDALLARAGPLLSAALSVDETARAVVRLAVPEVAAWCVVELAREGRLERIAAAPPDAPASAPDAPDAGLTLPL